MPRDFNRAEPAAGKAGRQAIGRVERESRERGVVRRAEEGVREVKLDSFRKRVKNFLVGSLDKLAGERE